MHMRQLHLIIYLMAWMAAFDQNDPMHRYNTKFTLSEQDFVDTIPIEFENDQLYVRVYSEGRTYRMNIDTGSSQGIAYVGGTFPYGRILGKVESRDANGRIDTIHAVAFPSFTLGRITISGYSGSLFRRHHVPNRYDAIIGFDLFNKGLSAKIDTRKGIMVLTDRRHFFDEEDGYTWRYRLLRFVPNVKLSPYPNCIDEALFDTGSRRLYVMGNRSLNIFQDRFPDFSTQIESRSHGRRAVGGFGAEKSDALTFLWLDGFNLGGYEFRDYHTMTTQGYSRIGGELLRYGTLIIEPRRKTMTFQPYNDDMAIMVSNAQTNIAFIPQNDRPVVGMVWEGGPHYRNGFRQGDMILQIDNQFINTFSDFLSFPFIEGRQHTFLVRSQDGSIHEIISER